MKKLILCLTLFAMCGSLDAQEESASANSNVAGYTTRDATVLSMMGWGISLAVGIAALVALIDNSTSTSHSH